MDLNDIRAYFSVVMFALIVGIYFWAWSKKRKDDFNEAANLPFSEPEFPTPLEKNILNKKTNRNSGEKV